MIIVRLSDGFGNQMFQYAIGFALSVYHKTSLLLDISSCGRWHNGFELQQAFSFPVQLAQPEDMRNLLGWQSPIYIRYLLTNPALKILLSRRFVLEPHFHYCQEIKNLTPPFYLQGYWQSEKYFADVENEIRADFKFSSVLSDCNRKIAEDISAFNSVSLHVRRGDYANDPRILLKHGLCSVSYYEKAVKYIRKLTQNPYFFIFSDDMSWAKTNLNIAGSVCFVDCNRGPESYNDMRLMSMCKHHIIANSSFSWWGAWLNPSKEKIVIAPRRWFAHYSLNTKDLIPNNWVKL